MGRMLVHKALIAMLLILAAVPLRAQDAAGFYADKVIRWIVPYRPGGGYDEYSRLLVPFLEKYSGADVEIVNTPGSGGLRGAVEIYRSPADGLHMGIINGSGLVYNTVTGMKRADYDLGAFTYLARLTAEERSMVVLASGPLQSFETVMSDGAPLVIGATGLGASSNLDAIVAGYLLGIDQKLIVGFNNSADLRLALLRGDIDAMWGTRGSAADGMAAGDFRIILDAQPHAGAGTDAVASVAEMAQERGLDADRLRLLDAWLAMLETGRPLVGPPGIPAERAAFLRDVLARALNDAEFRARVAAAGRSLAVLSGQEMADIIRRATELDDNTRALLIAATKGAL